MSTEYLTVAEAAARLKVSKRTIRRWVEAGSVESIKIGSIIRVAFPPVSDPSEKVSA